MAILAVDNQPVALPCLAGSAYVTEAMAVEQAAAAVGTPQNAARSHGVSATKRGTRWRLPN